MAIEIKHIAIICNYKLLEDRIGGMDYFFWAFNKKCKAQNIKVDWFFPNKSTHGAYANFNIIEGNAPSIEKQFVNYIENNTVNYAYVITHFVELCTSFFKDIKNKIDTKIIVVDHNARPLNGYAMLKTLKKKVKGLLFSRYIDQFIGVSDSKSHAILKDFGGFLKPKTKTIYNGLELDIFQKKDSFLNLNKFLTTSHLTKGKGIEDVIKAVALLPVELSNTMAIELFGDGALKQALEKMVNANNLSHVITFKGSVMDLNKRYKNFDYLIHPSKAETFCYSVLEAVVCNLPVITTQNNGNILGLIKNNVNGFLYEEGNVEALSAILKQILLKNKRILTVYNRSLEHEFSIELMVNNHFNLIN